MLSFDGQSLYLPSFAGLRVARPFPIFPLPASLEVYRLYPSFCTTGWQLCGFSVSHVPFYFPAPHRDSLPPGFVDSNLLSFLYLLERHTGVIHFNLHSVLINTLGCSVSNAGP